MKRWNFGNLWSYEVKQKLIENGAQVGDVVENIGYICDYDKNNYKSAIITRINKVQVLYKMIDEV
jgi:hypothetical protein